MRQCTSVTDRRTDVLASWHKRESARNENRNIAVAEIEDHPKHQIGILRNRIWAGRFIDITTCMFGLHIGL